MTLDAAGHAEQIQTIAQIKAEYEKQAAARTQPSAESKASAPTTADSRIGDIWYNCITNEYFICNGRINGVANWVKLLEVLEP
jgi:hypothetical protein